MIYVIYPYDSTTQFLLQIPQKIEEKIGQKSVQMINIEPSDDSYLEGIEKINKISENSILLFMGHGQSDLLFGAESESFPKKPFIGKSEIRLFEKKYLFSLSCYSNEFLKSTFSYSNIINSIGFGTLPTEMTEVENNKKLQEQGVTEQIITNYKEILIEIVSLSFCNLIKRKSTFFEMSSHFLLLLNKKISGVILSDKVNKENKILADLLFQMKSEMVFI